MTDNQTQTDKEQIIIDGVDVSKCRYFRPGSALTCSRMYGGACDNKYSNELCYFKQLAHKTRECEELKKQLSLAKDNETVWMNQHKLLYDKYTEVLNLAKQNADANEYCLRDLEEENKELRYQIACSRGREKGYLKNSVFWETLASKYKQALDEIEGIVRKTKRNMCNNCGWVNTVSCVHNDYVCGKLLQILDIISKAKGVED